MLFMLRVLFCSWLDGGCSCLSMMVAAAVHALLDGDRCSRSYWWWWLWSVVALIAVVHLKLLWITTRAFGSSILRSRSCFM
jgi:uncharacterized membrane protein